MKKNILINFNNKNTFSITYSYEFNNNTELLKIAKIYYNYKILNKKINFCKIDEKLNSLKEKHMKPFLIEEFNINEKQIDKIYNLLSNYTQDEKFNLITNILKNPFIKKNNFLLEFLENFGKLKNGKFKKYNLKSLNLLTLYFLMIKNKINIFHKFKTSKDKNRKYIVDYIKILNSKLKQKGLGILIINK